MPHASMAGRRPAAAGQRPRRDLCGQAGSRGSHQALAQARMQTVRGYLVARGIAAAIIRTPVQGDCQPVSACQGSLRSRAEALECLLPNRRVEVNFVALRQP